MVGVIFIYFRILLYFKPSQFCYEELRITEGVDWVLS